MLKPALLVVSLATMLIAPAFAQRATPAQMGSLGDRSDYTTLHLQCNLGSFKIIPGQGRMEVNFTGTFLISGLKGTHTATGNLTKEFEGMERIVYHGTGTIVVEGEWRSLHWFGSDMAATWYGNGKIRVTGEFDRNLKTGEYWFEDTEDHGYWGTNMQEFMVPPMKPGLAPGQKPTRRGGS